MSRFRLSDFVKLSVSERLKFVDEIWNSGALTPGMLQLTDEERSELKRRMRDFAVNPDDGSPWPEVKERILKRGRPCVSSSARMRKRRHQGTGHDL